MQVTQLVCANWSPPALEGASAGSFPFCRSAPRTPGRTIVVSEFGMDVLQQAMLAIGLASCAGLRAWLPVFAAGLLARFGWLPLDGSFEILKSDAALVTL